MSLSVSCPCGARFEVEETYAGQSVSCPECHGAVPVSVRPGRPLRTSGLAIASVVLALVLAFTGIGTVVAVILGVIGLVHISLYRNEVTGTGFALFGIGAGCIFTVLFGLAVVRIEVFGFDLLRGSLMGHDVDLSGPLEVTRPEDGFAINRPTPHWGVAKDALLRRLAPDAELMLANLGKDAYLSVSQERLAGRSLEEYRNDVIDSFRNNYLDDFGNRRAAPQPNNVTVRQSRTLPARSDQESLEMLLEVRMGPVNSTYLVRVVRPRGSDDVYLLHGWTSRRRFVSMEKELREALDSFRLLKQ